MKADCKYLTSLQVLHGVKYVFADPQVAAHGARHSMQEATWRSAYPGAAAEQLINRSEGPSSFASRAAASQAGAERPRIRVGMRRGHDGERPQGSWRRGGSRLAALMCAVLGTTLVLMASSHLVARGGGARLAPRQPVSPDIACRRGTLSSWNFRAVRWRSGTPFLSQTPALLHMLPWSRRPADAQQHVALQRRGAKRRAFACQDRRANTDSSDLPCKPPRQAARGSKSTRGAA